MGSMASQQSPTPPGHAKNEQIHDSDLYMILLPNVSLQELCRYLLRIVIVVADRYLGYTVLKHDASG